MGSKVGVNTRSQKLTACPHKKPSIVSLFLLHPLHASDVFGDSDCVFGQCPPPVTVFKGRLFVDTDKENDLRVAIKQCVYDKKDTIPAIVCVFSTVRLGKIFTNCYRKAR